MRCAWCRHSLDEVHGHGACLNNVCPMFGLNQDECCSGETAGLAESAREIDEAESGEVLPTPPHAPAPCVRRTDPDGGTSAT